MANVEQDIKIIISSNIKHYIDRDNRTRKEVCKDLNIKYTTFCDWINAKTIPSYNSLEILGRYFNVEPWDFYKSRDEHLHRISIYAKELDKGRLLDMSILDTLDDEQVKALVKSGFRFKHRTLEEYIELSGKPLRVSEEYDWGEPVGREIW